MGRDVQLADDAGLIRRAAMPNSATDLVGVFGQVRGHPPAQCGLGGVAGGGERLGVDLVTEPQHRELGMLVLP